MRVIKKDIDIFIDQLQKGDEGAFRVLFDEFYTALCLFAERFLGERGEFPVVPLSHELTIDQQPRGCGPTEVCLP